MNYLLDTHTFLWALFDEEKLSKTVKKTLESRDNSIYVSAVTFWEVSLKFSIGKLQLFGVQPSDLPNQAQLVGFEHLALTAEQSAGFYQLELNSHKDPFDRMVIWQAIQQNLILISKDEKFSQYGIAGLKTFW